MERWYRVPSSAELPDSYVETQLEGRGGLDHQVDSVQL